MSTSRTKLPQITIGIPAFNEQANIALILEDILKQVQHGFKIHRIIVASDGSTDATVSIALSVANRLIKVINSRRQGKAVRLMQIIRLSHGTIPVILDADTRLTDRKFLVKLVAPIISGAADLTSAAQAEIRPTGLIDQALYASMQVLNRAYSEFRLGANFFTCHGQARAFSPRLAYSLKLPFSSGEDLYTYLFCRYKDYIYKYIPEAVTHYQLPTTLSDHFRQSSRFVQSVNRVKSVFPGRLVEQEMQLPYYLIAKYTLIYFFRYPLSMLLYVGIFIYSRIIAGFGNFVIDTWTMSPTSKSLVKI